jgi:hypothetical protein
VIRPYPCGATGKFWRYKIGAMQHLVCELPGTTQPVEKVGSARPAVQECPKTSPKRYRNGVFGPRTGSRREREGVFQQAGRKAEVRGIVGPGSYPKTSRYGKSVCWRPRDATRAIYALAGPRPRGERQRTAPAVPVPAMSRGVCCGVCLDPVFSRSAQIFFGRGARAYPVSPSRRGSCYPRVRVPRSRPNPRVLPVFPRAALRGPYGNSRQRVKLRYPICGPCAPHSASVESRATEVFRASPGEKLDWRAVPPGWVPNESGSAAKGAQQARFSVPSRIPGAFRKGTTKAGNGPPGRQVSEVDPLKDP